MSKFHKVFEACERIFDEREAEYPGSQSGMFQGIGILAAELVPGPFYSEGVVAAAHLLALKLKRLGVNPSHGDSLVDCINYLCFFSDELVKQKQRAMNDADLD